MSKIHSEENNVAKAWGQTVPLEKKSGFETPDWARWRGVQLPGFASPLGEAMEDF
jgi:hypothetical protein